MGREVGVKERGVEGWGGEVRGEGERVVRSRGTCRIVRGDGEGGEEESGRCGEQGSEGEIGEKRGPPYIHQGRVV